MFEENVAVWTCVFQKSKVVQILPFVLFTGLRNEICSGTLMTLSLHGQLGLSNIVKRALDLLEQSLPFLNDLLEPGSRCFVLVIKLSEASDLKTSRMLLSSNNSVHRTVKTWSSDVESSLGRDSIRTSMSFAQRAINCANSGAWSSCCCCCCCCGVLLPDRSKPGKLAGGAVCCKIPIALQKLSACFSSNKASKIFCDWTTFIVRNLPHW